MLANRHKLRPLYVETSYPFGLFRRGYRNGEPQEVLVFPPIRDIQLSARPPHSDGGEAEGGRKGQGEEFYGLRPFQEGDDARTIQWKVSYRRGRLMVREDAQQQRRRVTIRLATGESPDLLAFEDAVGLAASLVHAYLKAGYEVGYQGPNETVAPASGRPQLVHILSSLALVAPGEGLTPAPLGRGGHITVGIAGGVAVAKEG